MKKSRKAALAAIGATALPLLAAPPASATSKPGISFEIVITPMACTSMGFDITSTSEEARLHLSIGGLTASVGPDVPAKEARKSCKIMLKPHFSVPSAWALKSIDSRGTADLEPEVTGEVTNGYQVQGGPAHEISHKINAPTRSWHFEDETPLEFVPCGQARNLNLETRLQVTTTDPAKSGSISLDSPGGGTTYRLVYKECRSS
ncbi:DUF4360 domain-containing protein [Actinomadura sp. NEAU-AAG7]|uniref:DUF4360 domain-containing protein n=1 Tax=Actinomadura sp. NEAU-AAG7 TaxID=2839640 RepID=UPI001BE4CA6C|nr:DUF4360 domain-containing protein [Actinomadura sp. NEAU-AAG7]MBT2207354.1 DUF4360 domain-containing protein [Actinomadura sp. NEAU-AAG7]